MEKFRSILLTIERNKNACFFFLFATLFKTVKLVLTKVARKAVNLGKKEQTLIFTKVKKKKTCSKECIFSWNEN